MGKHFGIVVVSISILIPVPNRVYYEGTSKIVKQTSP